jgi:radical SAM protein (TIGR01212 family)
MMPPPFPNGKRYNSYNEYFKRIFGGRVQKLSVHAGFTCPNRDGTIATRGCTFCDNDAFHPSYCKPEKPIRQQLSEGMQFHAWRYRRAINYLAYFQAFSNTYAAVGHLRKVYEEALAVPGVIGLVIGTRPDCISDEILDYIAELSSRYYIIVEYGVESCYNTTLAAINRGHDAETSFRAIRDTAARGIRTGAHFIFGLPGETQTMMMEMAGMISALPLDTVKFHQLQIVKGTKMEQTFSNFPQLFHQFSLEAYIDFITRFLERLNPDIVVERFAGEVPPAFLNNNPWKMIRYDALARMIESNLATKDTWQGRLYT